MGGRGGRKAEKLRKMCLKIGLIIWLIFLKENAGCYIGNNFRGGNSGFQVTVIGSFFSHPSKEKS